MARYTCFISLFILIFFAACQDFHTGEGAQFGQQELPLDGFILSTDEPFFAGEGSRLNVEGGPAGATMRLYYSMNGTGAGPCPPTTDGLCFDIVAPMVSAGMVLLDESGAAVKGLMLPELPEENISIQGMVFSGADSVSTNVLEGVIESNNHPPRVRSVTLEPAAPNTADILTAVLEAGDQDGDPITIDYRWFVDGTPVMVSGDTLDGAEYFDAGQTVRLRVTAHDGIEISQPRSAITTVVNSPPGTPAVAIEPATPEADTDDLLCLITVPSSDLDGDTLTYTVNWQLNSEPYTGPTSTSSLPGDTISSDFTSVGDTWSCSVFADDATDSGEEAFSATVTVVPSPIDCSDLSGTLTEDTTLTADGGPCFLNGDLTVSPDITLFIAAGTEILATGNYQIEIKGSLYTAGTETEPVIFASAMVPASAGDWGGLRYSETGDGELNGVDIAHASYGIYAETDAPTVTHTKVHDCDYGGYYYSTSATVSDSTFYNNNTGLYVSWGSVTVSRSQFEDNGVGILGGSAASTDVNNSTIRGNAIGIQPDGGTISHNDIMGNGVGISTQNSHNTITYNRIENNETGVILGGYPIRKTLNYNAFSLNTEYAVVYGGGYDDGTVDATYNFWGSDDAIDISETIWDVFDDVSLFQVNFVPYLEAPHVGVGIIPMGTIDNDGDGFYADGNDCDDSLSWVRPEGLDTTFDSIDDDCDGMVDDDLLTDNDGDGYLSDVDCEDENEAVYPGATEIAYNGIDDDCDGVDLTPYTSEFLSGVLSFDSILTLEFSPYLITGDFAIPPGVTLVVESSVEIWFTGPYEMLVKGVLRVEGETDKEVLFTSVDMTPGAWSGITFEGGGHGTLDYFVLEYADTGIRADLSGPSLSYATLRHCNTGLDTYSTTTEVDHCTLTENDRAAYVSWGSLSLDRCAVTHNGTGIEGGSASNLTLTNSDISHNDVGLNLDGATVDHNHIADNGVGVLTQNSNVTMTYNIIERNGEGVILGGYPIRKIMNFNSFTDNSEFAVVYSGGYDDGQVDATYNWWGTTQSADIQSVIWDVYDDISLFEVNIYPFLWSPHVGVGIIPEGTIDNDGDGFYADGNDCDDTLSWVLPEGLDDTLDGVDDDCDGYPDDDVLYDLDGDGYTNDVDCNDLNELINPGMVELPGDDLDEDCNGSYLAEPASSILSGVFGGDTYLGLGPYLVTDNIAVPPGVTLYIDEGVSLLFDGPYSLLVKGNLVVAGNATNQVIMTSSAASGPGDWIGVILEGDATGEITGLLLEFADIGLNVDRSSLLLDESTITQCNRGLEFYSPTGALVTGTQLLDNGTGLYVSWGGVDILDSSVIGNDIGIEGGSAATTNITNCLITENNIGARPDGGTISHNLITHNSLGVETQLSYNAISYNLFEANTDAVFLGGYPVRKTINYNSFIDQAGYDVIYGGGYDDGEIDATYNWWGTTDIMEIEEGIWDFYDDPALFVVNYDNFLIEPDPAVGFE